MEYSFGNIDHGLNSCCFCYVISNSLLVRFDTIHPNKNRRELVGFIGYILYTHIDAHTMLPSDDDIKDNSNSNDNHNEYEMKITLLKNNHYKVVEFMEFGNPQESIDSYLDKLSKKGNDSSRERR